MSDDDLVRVTGKRRYTKQAEWFRTQFGVDVVCAGNGKIIMPWATYEALSDKKAGISHVGVKKDFELHYD